MFQQFGLDMFSPLFVALIDAIVVAAPSVWIGEMSITGVVPDNTTSTGDPRPYTF